jgi:hypothetical protein
MHGTTCQGSDGDISMSSNGCNKTLASVHHSNVKCFPTPTQQLFAGTSSSITVKLLDSYQTMDNNIVAQALEASNRAACIDHCHKTFEFATASSLGRTEKVVSWAQETSHVLSRLEDTNLPPIWGTPFKAAAKQAWVATLLAAAESNPLKLTQSYRPSPGRAHWIWNLACQMMGSLLPLTILRLCQLAHCKVLSGLIKSLPSHALVGWRVPCH